MAIYFYQRSNGKYGEIVEGDLSKVKKMKGQYSIATAIKRAKEDGAGQILTWTDRAECQKACGKPTSHGWRDGGTAYLFE